MMEKRTKENDNPSILSVTVTDLGYICALDHLPYPTELNTGGFRVIQTIGHNPKPAYSPIDLSICGIQSILDRDIIPITNLSLWFRDHPIRQSDHYVYINILDNTTGFTNCIHTYTVAHLRQSGLYNALLRKSAPFTMK